jgi:L-lactate utilization protein LutB
MKIVDVKMYNPVLGSIEMNNQQVIEIAKECGLVYNNNHDILEFYQKIRKELKKEFQTESVTTK